MPTFPSFQTGEAGIVEGRREQYAPDPRAIPPSVEGFEVSEADTSDIDGTIGLGFVIDFQEPRSWGKLSYDVYAKNTTDGDSEFKHIASVSTPGAIVAHPYLSFIGSSYTFAVVSRSSYGRALPPEDGAQDTIVPAALGPEVPDVTNFDAIACCCDVVFTWTPRSDPWIEYYEIRQGANWAAGVLVLVIGPGPRNRVVVRHADIPTALGTSATFHIKAVSRTRKLSATEDSDTLTALEIATLEMPCCTGGREIALSPGDTFTDITSVRPFPNGAPFPIVGGGGNPGGGSQRGMTGRVDASSFVKNGNDTWTYRVYLDDVALASDTIYVAEIG